MCRNYLVILLIFCALVSCTGLNIVRKQNIKLMRNCSINRMVSINDSLVRVGLWMINNDSVNVHIINYRKGVKHGQEMVSNKEKNEVKVIHYKKGKYHGFYYYSDGNYTERLLYKRGKKKRKLSGIKW